MKDITGGRGAYVSLEAVGGKGTADVIKATRDGGQVIFYGAMGGGGFQGVVPDLLFRNVVLKGFWLGVWMQTLGERREEVVNELRADT